MLFGFADGDLLFTIGCRELSGVFDLLFFFDNRPLNRNTLFNYVLNVLLFDFDRFFFFDLSQRHNTLAFGRFDALILSNTLSFNRVGPLFTLGRDDDRTQFVLFGDLQFFLGLNPSGLVSLTLLFLYNFGFGFFTSCDFGNFTKLFLLGFRLLTFEGQNGFTCLHILLLDRLLFLTSDVVGSRDFFGGQVGDLFDTFGVQNVVRIQLLKIRLLQVVDRRVIQHVTVQVRTDNAQDLLTELFA